MKRILLVLVLTPLLFISSCTKDSNPVDSGTPSTPGGGGKISTGQSVDLGSQTIGTSGGTITINKLGDPLNGFQISVPANGFTQPQTFAVSYAPITSHQLGSYINPASPLITITSGGGYSSSAMKLKVPIKLPAGCFAMGFIYDETTGSIEALPLAGLDSTSVTISTRHLSPSDVQLGKGLRKSANLASGTIFISYILLSVLGSQTTISSGFTPGVDDWEFPNNGSFIAPGGHCAGQCATAIWYYYEKKLKGGAGLFHQFDKINDPMKPDSLWCDNSRGYRFASTVHQDIDQGHTAFLMDVASWVPDLVFDAFVYSMLVTGRPQMVGVMNSSGLGGHALVVYKIDVLGSRLYVADPNYPNNRDPRDGTPVVRAIEYVPGYITGRFKPYSISAKAGEKTILCDQIGYAAAAASIDWAKISQRWTEFNNGTIGNDRFPSYALIDHGTGSTFADGLSTDRDSLKLRSEVPGCLFFAGGIPDRQAVSGYDSLGGFLRSVDGAGVLTLRLKPGDNKFGLYMMAAARDTQYHFLDFKWVNVRRRINLTIVSTEANRAPLSTAGIKNKVYSFIAKTDRPLPNDGKLKYEWSFGGTPPTSINNDSTVTHTFAQEGTFTIDVGFYYDLKKISNVTAQATIGPTPSPVITSITPSSGSIGDTIKIAGKNFGLDRTKGTVTFSTNVVATQTVIWNDTTITAKIPQGSQTGPVTVTINSLTSNAVTFTVAPAPLITSITPSTAKANDTISIDGNYFGTDKTKGTVVFTGSLVAGNGIVSWTNTRIRAVVPVTASTGPLSVSVNAITSNQVLFTLLGPPSITSVSPTQVSYAMPVRISGKNFGAAQGTSTIRFGTYIPKSVVSWRDNEIVATVPEQFAGGVVTLIIGGVTCVSGSLGATLQIVSVTPDSAFANEVVTIHGKQFGYEQGRSRVVVSYVDTATVVSWSDTSLAVIVPDPSNHYYGTRPIKIILGNGIDRTFNNFFIIEDVLETLHRTQYIYDISMGGMMTMYRNPPGINELKENSLGFGAGFMIKPTPLIWSGTTFHASYSYANTTDTSLMTFDGRVSDDGKTVLTVTARYAYSTTYSPAAGYGYTQVTEFAFRNVRLDLSTPNQNSVVFRVSGATARDNVVAVTYERKRQGIVTDRYVSTDWTNATRIPGIFVGFH